MHSLLDYTKYQIHIHRSYLLALLMAGTKTWLL
jgi:hypothetical protein